MNEPFYFTKKLATPIAAIAELAVVRLLREIDASEGVLPRGAVGVVVAVYGVGEAYEVEFSEPIHALASVPFADLEVIEAADEAAATDH